MNFLNSGLMMHSYIFARHSLLVQENLRKWCNSLSGKNYETFWRHHISEKCTFQKILFELSVIPFSNPSVLLSNISHVNFPKVNFSIFYPLVDFCIHSESLGFGFILFCIFCSIFSKPKLIDKVFTFPYLWMFKVWK